ncbi:MAG TPA: CocE/NonD family hydrolase [Streptosporangiaceae bacterium]|nr:CocE/NonD family hydrolase [Streptosporangiaceae bacterium]
MTTDQNASPRTAGARPPGRTPAPGRGTGRLPVHVRVMRRLSGRDLPGPVCDVGLERGIAVPAADGVPLITDHYVPLAGGPWPTLLVRSPYGRGFPWDTLLGAMFAGQGFHVVLQSCRGTGGSGGDFEPARADAADGQATVAWLRQQAWFTGELATIGMSYLGWVQWALAADPPPELRAMVVQVGIHDLHGFLYQGGAFKLADALTGTTAALAAGRGFARFLAAALRAQRRTGRAGTRLPLIDAYTGVLGGRRAGFFEDWLTHPDGADPYWRGLSAPAAAGLAVPVSLVSGWYDVNLDQTLDQYARLRASGRPPRLLIGPWTHTSAFDKGWPVVFADALAVLRAHLGGEGAGVAGAAGSPVRVHVGGTADEWRDWPDWPPPAAAQAWYPGGDGGLGQAPPAGDAVSALRYDPSAPTPSAGGPVANGQRAGRVRNDAVERRPDVLVFTGPPLAAPVTVAGPVSARFRARGSSGHFDVFARLCDVDPRGRSWNVCDGMVRVDADGWADVTVPMSSAAYEFGAGHRLRLQVAGGAHPRFARNTGTGEPLATATALVPGTTEVAHGPDSVLTLPVIPPGAGT